MVKNIRALPSLLFLGLKTLFKRCPDSSYFMNFFVELCIFLHSPLPSYFSYDPHAPNLLSTTQQ